MKTRSYKGYLAEGDTRYVRRCIRESLRAKKLLLRRVHALLEAAVLGFVPLFVRGVPHAYSEFHLTGVHYLTVSCVLVPALTVLYFLEGGSRRSPRPTAARYAE